MGQKVRARVPISHLHAKGILKPHFHRNKIDGRLIEPMQNLQKSFKADVLNQAFRERPTHEDLYRKGILNADHHIAKMDPRLVQPSMALAKSFKTDMLKQQLERRSSIQKMKAKNILHASHGDVCHSMLSQSIALDKSFKKDALSRGIRKRPSLTHLHDRGIVDKGHPRFSDHPEVDGQLPVVQNIAVEAAGPTILEHKERNRFGRDNNADQVCVPEAGNAAADEDADLDLKSCLVEVQRALKNLKELRGWLEKIPN